MQDFIYQAGCVTRVRPWLILPPAAPLKFAVNAPKRVTLATLMHASLYQRHCEERSDAAIHWHRSWIASLRSQ